MKITPDDLTPKERELQRYLVHLADAHQMTDVAGDPDCWQCDNFRKALS